MCVNVTVLAILVLVGFGAWATTGAPLAGLQPTGWLVFTIFGSALLLFQAGLPGASNLRKLPYQKPCRRHKWPRTRRQVARSTAIQSISSLFAGRRQGVAFHPVTGRNRCWWELKWLLKVALWLGSIVSPDSRHPNPASRRAPAWGRPVVTPDGPGLRHREMVAEVWGHDRPNFLKKILSILRTLGVTIFLHISGGIA